MKKYLVLVIFSFVFITACSNLQGFFYDKMREIKETPMPVRTDTFINTYMTLSQTKPVVDISGYWKDGDYVTFNDHVKDGYFFAIQNKAGYMYSINFSTAKPSAAQYEVIYLSLGMEDNEEFRAVLEEIENWDIDNVSEENSYFETIENNGVRLSTWYNDVGGYTIFAISAED